MCVQKSIFSSLSQLSEESSVVDRPYVITALDEITDIHHSRFYLPPVLHNTLAACALSAEARTQNFRTSGLATKERLRNLEKWKLGVTSEYIL